MVQIYLDDESRELLTRIKKEHADFKLSSYIQMAIANYYGKNIESIDDIKNKIKDNEEKISLLNQEILKWNERIEQIMQEKLKEAKKVEQEQKEYIAESKYREFWLNATPEMKKEYNEGLKLGKYHNTVHYYNLKMKEQTMLNNQKGGQ